MSYNRVGCLALYLGLGLCGEVGGDPYLGLSGERKGQRSLLGAGNGISGAHGVDVVHDLLHRFHVGLGGLVEPDTAVGH